MAGRPRAVLLSNPVASGVTPNVEAIALHPLALIAEVQLIRTEGPGHAGEIGRQAVKDGCDAIIVLGGDGTANQVVNAVGSRIAVGVLPGGGTSVLARTLGLPRSVRAAAAQVAEALHEGRETRRKLGVLNGRRFTFAAGIGFDADAVRLVDRRGRARGRRPGDAYFAMQVARLAVDGSYRKPRLTVKVAGAEAERVAFLMAANVHPWTFLGPLGVPIAPLADADAGGIDFVGPRRFRRRDLPAAARYVLLSNLEARTDDDRVLYVHGVQRAIVACDVPLPAEVDGEDIGDITEAVFSVDHDGVRLLA